MNRQPSFSIASDQPFIDIPFHENGKEIIRYFSEEDQADKAVSEDATQKALSLAGAWSDLDRNKMEKKLNRLVVCSLNAARKQVGL